MKPLLLQSHRLPALLYILLACPLTGAVPPPAGTVTALNNIGLFDSGAGTLTSCVTMQDAQGKPQLDATGKPQMYDIVMSLTGQNLVFQLQTYTPIKPNAGKDCSGVFMNGSYTDKVLVKYPGFNLDGSVLNVVLDLISNNLQFKLRTDSPNFSVTRNFIGNTTQLGSNLGDFQTSATREYGTANLPPTITLKLPACNDPQGDDTRVIIERNGTVLAGGQPGSTFAFSPAALSVGDYLFRTYCSDEIGISNLASSMKLAVDPAYIAKSGYAPGTVKISIINGTSTSQSNATAPITFTFDPATSASDQQLIQQAAQFARDFMLATFGRTLQKAATITTSTTAAGCTNGGGSAFTGSQNLNICIANFGWTVHDTINRQKIVIHEMFHLLQFELHWLGGAPTTTGPQWLIEGAAEYVGWLGIANQNLLAFATARGCMVKQVADFAQQQPPGLPNLSQLESGQQFSMPGPVYPLAMIGVDQLVTASGVNSLLNYGTALASGTAYASAFQTAFTTPLATFYNQFPAYKAGLTVPANFLCGN